MFKILFVLFAAFVPGRLLRHRLRRDRLDRTLSATVLLLLFAFGYGVGADGALLAQLGRFGLRAAVLAAAGVAGSVAAAWGLQAWIGRHPTKREGTPVAPASASREVPAAAQEDGAMWGSLPVVGAFALGVAGGYFHVLPSAWPMQQAGSWLLCLLIAQVGLSLGAHPRLGDLPRSLRPAMWLLPLATVAGTLGASALVGAVTEGPGVAGSMAVGSGMAYYSLSSVLIVDLMTPVAGARMAAELGTLALLTNLLRELFALVATPWLVRRCGALSAISVAGAGSMDTLLPLVSRCAGPAFVPLALLHGLALEVSVPILVTLCCAL